MVLPNIYFQVLNEINVERSPALRKLMKQDEISEEPFQRTTTRASVQSSPWDVRLQFFCTLKRSFKMQKDPLKMATNSFNLL